MKNMTLIFAQLRLYYERARTQEAWAENDWHTMLIIDNNEPLVELSHTICCPFYFDKMGIGKNQKIFVRESLQSMLYKAWEITQFFGYDLAVYDGWRSVLVQETLYWLYMKNTIAQVEPSLKEKIEMLHGSFDIEQWFASLPEQAQETLHAANRLYISWPSKDPMCPSPHTTGGAVDVWLHKDGEPVDMGVKFDTMTLQSGAFYHLGPPNGEKVPWNSEVNRARTILLYAMLKSGFSCYPGEFWHFNYGNQMDSVIKKRPAKYGYIEP